MKTPLSYAWRERPASDVMLPALAGAIASAPRPVKNATYRYHHAQVVVTPSLVHEVHVLHDAEAKRTLISWTGRGVRGGTVVMTEGLGLETVRRRIESGAISSVPRAISAPPRVKARRAATGQARIARLNPAPARRLLPAP